MGGHGKLGAAAGCVIGHREANKQNPNDSNAQAPSGRKQSDEASGTHLMKIRSHSESHIVELEDGSRWQIFLGDLDLTLDWKPETELTVVETGMTSPPTNWSAAA